jgi:hypothetical protein
MPDYKQWIRQVKLARFERLSLAAGLEAERQGLTEEELGGRFLVNAGCLARSTEHRLDAAW